MRRQRFSSKRRGKTARHPVAKPHPVRRHAPALPICAGDRQSHNASSAAVRTLSRPTVVSLTSIGDRVITPFISLDDDTVVQAQHAGGSEHRNFEALATTWGSCDIAIRLQLCAHDSA
jgi:hypothetical protein